MASDPQVAQINLIQHQCTDLPPSKHKKKKSFVKSRPKSHKNDASDRQPVPSYHNNSKKSFNTKHVYKNKERCQTCDDSVHVEGFQCPAKNTSASLVTNFGHFISLCYQKKQVSSKPRKPNAHMLQTGAVYACDKSICSNSEDLSSSDDSFCFQVRIQHTQSDCKKIATPSHLITNLA